MQRFTIVLLLITAFAFCACNQQTCPSANSSGRGGPSGDGGKTDQKLFDKDMR